MDITVRTKGEKEQKPLRPFISAASESKTADCHFSRRFPFGVKRTRFGPGRMIDCVEMAVLRQGCLSKPVNHLRRGGSGRQATESNR